MQSLAAVGFQEKYWPKLSVLLCNFIFLPRFLWSWLSQASHPAWLLCLASRARTIPLWTSTASRTPASTAGDELMEGESSPTIRLVFLTFSPRFYSDEEAFCQMYHMCVAEASNSFKKYSFLCPNGQSSVPPFLVLSSLSQAPFSTKRSWCAMPGSM